MPFDLDAENLYRRAVSRRMRTVQESEEVLAADSSDEAWLDARIAVAELMMWAVGYAVDVRKQPRLKTKAQKAAAMSEGLTPNDLSHFLTGAYWARNAASHGEASIIEIGPLGQLDDADCDSSQVLWNDALPDDVSRDHSVLRFRLPAKPSKHSQDLLPLYQACIMGERVNLVAGLLSGETTLSGTRGFPQLANPAAPSGDEGIPGRLVPTSEPV